MHNLVHFTTEAVALHMPSRLVCMQAATFMHNSLQEFMSHMQFLLVAHLLHCNDIHRNNSSILVLTNESGAECCHVVTTCLI
jgi:hypothetical protein